jgi:hypothetical protein
LPVPLADVLVGPHVDDLVQRPDLGVPERGQGRDLLALLVGLAEAFSTSARLPTFTRYVRIS